MTFDHALVQPGSAAPPNPVVAFLRRADAEPDAVAIVSASVTLRAGDVADTVRRAASRLRRLGLRPAQVVAIAAPPEWEAILTLAVMHEGAASLHASAPVLDAHRDAIDVLLGDPPPGVRTPASCIPVDGPFFSELGAVNPAIDPRPLSADSLARIVFSSGTTGTPKGVPFTVELLDARIASARRHWMPADPFFSLLGIDTVSGFQTFVWSALNGKPWISPSTPEHNRDLIERLGVRSIKTSPARLGELLRAVEKHGPIPSLEVVQVAGAAMPGVLIERCQAVLGLSPISLYGSTEGGTVTRGEMDEAHPFRVGAVVAESAVRIVGPGGQPSALGEVGIVEYRTPVTAVGYWRADERAAAGFRDGWFRPGDRGALTEEGELELHGRINDVTNAGGAKVDLAAVDAALVELGELEDAASYVFIDRDGLDALGIAYVADAHRADRARRDVERTMRVRFPNIRIAALVRLPSLPRTPSGKVHRVSLSAAMEA